MFRKIILVGIIIMICIGLLSACTPKKYGEFYTLQEAYDQELLTQQDLKNIAYYHNGVIEEEGFETMPKTPEILSVKTENAIKETRAYDLRNRSYSPEKKAKAKDILIYGYYGIYNNCVAVKIEDVYTHHNDTLWEIEIAGIIFHYNSGNRVIIWKES